MGIWEKLLRIFRLHRKLPKTKRLAVYHNAYRLRLVDLLLEDFSCFKQRSWARINYVLSPSNTSMLIHQKVFQPARSGQHLPQFLLTLKLDNKEFYAELAAFEWAMIEAFAAAAHATLTIYDLQAIPQQDWLNYRF